MVELTAPLIKYYQLDKDEHNELKKYFLTSKYYNEEQLTMEILVDIHEQILKSNILHLDLDDIRVFKRFLSKYIQDNTLLTNVYNTLPNITDI